MDCQQAQDAILESLDEPGPVDRQQAIDAHLAACPTCAAFASRQKALDTRLSASLAATALSPGFRAALHHRIALDTRQARLDALPDLVHFGSCAVATVACAMLLPFDTWLVVAAGTTVTLSTYVVLAAARHSFEDLD